MACAKEPIVDTSERQVLFKVLIKQCQADFRLLQGRHDDQGENADWKGD